MNDTTNTIPTQYQNPERQATAEFEGAETVFDYRLSEVEDRHGQTVYLLLRSKELDCGSHMAHSTEMHTFSNEKQIKKFIEEEKEFNSEHLAKAVVEMAEEFDIELDLLEMLDPYEEMTKRLTEAMETIPPNEAIVAAIDQEYPDYFEDSKEVQIVDVEKDGREE